MTENAKRPFKLTGKIIIICLVVWFVICSVFYISIHIWEGNRMQKLVKTGVSISKDISSQSGLPLLEKNITLLSRLIETIKQRPEVVFASIIDHKNKIIAYTDQEQFFTLNKQESGVLDDVHYWRISNLNNQKVMNFSSEVTFSNTRVGEVLISLAVKNDGQLKRLFLFFSVLSLMAIAFFCGIVNYKDLISWCRALKKNKRSPKETFIKDSGYSEISCPLCGNPDNFSLKGFQAPDLDKFFILKQYSGTHASILLSDIAKIEELSWLKRLIVAQCTKIINKIAAE